MKRIMLAVSVLSFSAIPALAQESMAQAAERQKKARKGQTKVITEDELKNTRSKGYAAASVDGAAAPQPGASPAAPGAAAAEGPPPKSDEQERAEKKAATEKKIKQWSDFIADTKKAMDTAQLELNDIGGTFGSRRAGLQRIIDEGNQHIAEAQQAIADLQEQARRAGLSLR